MVLYLSYYYTKKECKDHCDAFDSDCSPDLNISPVPIRLAFFWVATYIAHIVSAFLATGILKLRGVSGVAGWRYLFLIEGLLTFSIGIISFFMMPPGPTQTKAWFRPSGWFTERCVPRSFNLSTHLNSICSEEVILVNRVLRDDPSKSDMHNREGLSVRMIWEALKDWHLWPIYVLGLLHMSKWICFGGTPISDLLVCQYLSGHHKTILR
jgi:MFS family permease